LKKAISTFKTFLRWVRRSRLAIDEWVFEYKTPKHIPEERIAWNDEQVRRLLAECDKPNVALSLPSAVGTGRGSEAIMSRVVATRDFYTRLAIRPALRLMLRYAPRPIEVSRMVVGNWNSSTRTLYLPGKITKNGHPRDFVVDEEIAQILDEVAGDRPPKEPLFLSYKKRPYRSHHLTDLINVLIQRARLPGTAYSCRHTATTALIHLAKGDLPLVQSITGHRTLSELQRYLHATNDRRQVVAEAYNVALEAKPTPLPNLRFVE
jgi:integrase